MSAAGMPLKLRPNSSAVDSAAKIPKFLKAMAGFAGCKMPEIEIIVKDDLRVSGQQSVFGLSDVGRIVFGKHQVDFFDAVQSLGV